MPRVHSAHPMLPFFRLGCFRLAAGGPLASGARKSRYFRNSVRQGTGRCDHQNRLLLNTSRQKYIQTCHILTIKARIGKSLLCGIARDFSPKAPGAGKNDPGGHPKQVELPASRHSAVLNAKICGYSSF